MGELGQATAATDASILPEGGRYILGQRLGEGGQSEVYQARDTERGVDVALKVLARSVDLESGRTLMRREFLAMSGAAHPGVVEVYDFGTLRDGRPFFTMELVQGVPLSEYLRGGSEERAREVLESILDALDHIHREGVIHGDLKPGNILVREVDGKPQIKLLDFGLAALSQASAQLKGTIRGTVHYLAPEVIRDAPVDGRSDLYALGAALYEAFSGAPLWHGDRPEEVMRKHLDVEPPPLRHTGMSDAFMRLVMRMLEKDPRLRFASAAEARAAVRALEDGGGRPVAAGRKLVALQGAFVGRDAVLDLALHAAEECRSGGGSVLVIEGPEGSGKSRLLSEVRMRCLIQGALCVSGDRAGQELSPYGPWRLLGDALLSRRRLRGAPEESDLKGLFAEAPLSTDHAEDPEPVDLDAAVRRVRLFEATCRGIRKLTRDGAGPEEPVVLCIDDLDARDAGSREFLTFLARQMARLPLLVVATVAAPADRGSYPEEARFCRLDPLTMTQTGRLVATMVGVEDVDKRLASVVHEETAGNPADVEDFVRALIDEGALERDEVGDVRVREEAFERVPTPRRVLEYVQRQVAALDAESRVALSVASLLPSRFAPVLLSRTLGFSEELCFEVLGRLEGLGVVRCRAGAYTIPTGKLRSYLRDSLAPQSRRDLMDRIARALLSEREAHPETVADALLADYLEEGKRPQDAIPHLMAASNEAYALLAVRDAISYLKRAVALIISDPEGIDGVLLATAREQLADRLADAGEVADAIGIYDTLLLDLWAGEVRGEAAADGTAARLGMRLAKLHQRRGEYEKALEIMRRVLKELDRDKDAAFISEVLARIGWIYKSKGIYPEALKYCTRALKVAIESGEASKIANALNHIGVVHWNKGDWVQAQHYHRRALLALAGMPHGADAAEGASGVEEEELLRRASQDPVRARVIVNNLGNVHWKRGELGKARACYERALSLSEEMGDLSAVASSANNLALLHFGHGEWEEAIAGFQRSLEIKTKLGETEGLSVALNNLAEVYERIGRWRESRENYEKSLDIKMRLGEKKGAGEVQCTLANLYRKMGEIERAAREVARGFATLEEVGDADALAFGYYYRALVEKDRGDFVAALRFLTESISIMEKRGTLSEAARIYTSAADLHIRMGDLDKAEEYAEKSHRLAQELGDRFEEGKVMSALGRIRYQRRERAQAREAFERGIAILEELGARFELGRSAYEYGLRIEDPARAARYLEKAIGIFRSIGAVADLEHATGTYERIRENLQGFDAPSSRPAGDVVGLYETGKIINTSLDLDEVLERVMDVVLERTRADRGLILLLEADGNLRVRAARNIARENLKGLQDISVSIVHEVIRTQGPLLASNAALDPRFSSQKSIILHGIISIAAVPLRIRDRIAGAIYLDHLRSPDYFTDRDLKFLQAFSDQAAIAIENARLYKELREASDRLAAENRLMRAETRGRGAELVGGSRAFRQVMALLEKAASSGETTLFLGESGTGKSYLARAIHDMGPRREGPFVKFNCAALPETLVESELFGHERGSFTGADRRKLGRFEIASSGTIFLDEIGNVSQAVQSKLLRILEDKEFERVGGTQTIKTDAQILTATNRDLGKAIRDGSFREDLYYRLNIFPIHVPPLRDRKEDVPPLAERFLLRVNSELEIDRRGFSPDAMDLLVEYDWPGNVRELESAVRRSAVMAEGELIGPEDLRWLRAHGDVGPRREVLIEEAIGSFVRSPRRGEKVFQAVTENVERVLIRKVLSECSGQIREASRRLGVARNTLRSKMKRYGLQGKDEG